MEHIESQDRRQDWKEWEENPWNSWLILRLCFAILWELHSLFLPLIWFLLHIKLWWMDRQEDLHPQEESQCLQDLMSQGQVLTWLLIIIIIQDRCQDWCQLMMRLLQLQLQELLFTREPLTTVKWLQDMVLDTISWLEVTLIFWSSIRDNFIIHLYIILDQIQQMLRLQLLLNSVNK